MQLTWTLAYAEAECPAYAALTDEQIANFEQMAVDFLWRWTGRVFGTSEVTVRPCRTVGREGTWRGAMLPAGARAVGVSPVLVSTDPGEWKVQHGIVTDVSCGRCDGACSCRDSSAVIGLPAPVDSVVRVVQDGVELDPSTYRIDNRRLLVRQDGLGWPFHQNLDAPLGEVGTWGVTYVYGSPVPISGQMAAGALACELAKAYTGDNTCQLPRRFSSITRQGVTVAALDTFEDIDKGRTGIWSIDAWIASVTKAPQRSTVMSPDLPRRRRQTWP